MNEMHPSPPELIIILNRILPLKIVGLGEIHSPHLCMISMFEEVQSNFSMIEYFQKHFDENPGSDCFKDFEDFKKRFVKYEL